MICDDYRECRRILGEEKEGIRKMLPLEKEEVLVVYKGPQTKEKTKKKKKKKVKCGGTLQ